MTKTRKTKTTPEIRTVQAFAVGREAFLCKDDAVALALSGLCAITADRAKIMIYNRAEVIKLLQMVKP
jgi:hypothetical protein